jgi:hypothetical protein
LAIIIREEKMLPNGLKTVVKSYISDISPLPGHLRKKAEENDALIQAKVKEIEEDLDKLGLFSYKGKPGVLRLWYAFGTRLGFVDEMDLSASAKRYVWRAIYDHSTKLYDRTEPISVRLRDLPTSNDLRYSYIIGKLDWEFVNGAGSWRTWVDLLDSIVIREDPRIIQWIKRLQDVTPLRTGFLRSLSKAIRNSLRDRITSELDDSDLSRILDEIYEIALNDYAPDGWDSSAPRRFKP